jgi:hypothetical protein
MNIEPDELEQRLPELTTLDGTLRTETDRVFRERVPDHFWYTRASLSYHPPDERKAGGLWLHTKRVYTAYRMLEPTFRTLSRISQYEANCGRVAVLLHDALKYGGETDTSVPDEDGHTYHPDIPSSVPAYTCSEHDTEMCQYVQEQTELPPTVHWAISSHGGSTSWNTTHSGPPPASDIEMIVHLADIIASSEWHRLPVWRPHELLCENIPDQIPTLPDDVWVESDDAE